MAVVGGAFPIAIGRADGAAHVEHDGLRQLAIMHPVDPDAGKIGGSGQAESVVEFTVGEQTGV